MSKTILLCNPFLAISQLYNSVLSLSEAEIVKEFLGCYLLVRLVQLKILPDERVNGGRSLLGSFWKYLSFFYFLKY
jgi:hypothetical protein